MGDKKRPEYSLESAVTKLMMQVDERIAFEASGIATKKLTALNIQKHLDNFNLESQFGTYSKMHALSGGQKVKVVLASPIGPCRQSLLVGTFCLSYLCLCVSNFRL